jgi:Icc-related predicted phosphoesterase
MRMTWTILWVFGFAAFGCRSSSTPSSGKADGKKFLRCAEPSDDGGKESIRISPLMLEKDGLNLKISGFRSASVTLGLLSGIAEANQENFANLDFFLARFKEAGVQMIAVLGGLGTEESDTDGILKKIAEAPVPILAIPGAEENFDVFRKLFEKYKRQFPQLVDMTRVRRVQVGSMNFVSLPGYYKPFYLTGKDRGCAYQKDDIELTAKLFDEKGTNVMLAPSPPRGTGIDAVDRARGQVNIGDPELRRALDERKIKFGMFGHVYESGGHAVQADNATPVAAGIWAESLWIEAGAAEALPMFLVGEGRSAGMAQIVSFTGGRARYQTVFAPTRP